ncbi:MAG: cache domain-containing protein, partial [Chloroflexota bacterium]
TAGHHHLLITLAQLPEIRSGDPAGCSALLAELLKQYPGYTNLGVAALNGDLLCSAIPTSGPINYADREWFQRVLQTRNFVVGDYVIGRTTGKATLPWAYPVMNEAGELNFVVFAGTDLAFVNQLVATVQFPEGTVATVLDSDGTILAHYPDPEQWVGKTPQDAPIVQAILTQGEGTVETTGLDGVQRLYAFATLGEAAHVEGYVAVGIPSQVAYSGVNRILFDNLIGLGLAAILTFAAAWLGGEFFILRRTRALARTTQQLTSGDLSARTGITRPRGELSQLGHAFDQMAAALQEREVERKQVEEAQRIIEEKFRDVIENIFKFVPEGLLVLTDKLNVFRRNKALEDLVHHYAEKLNYSEEELADIIDEQVKMRVISGEKSDIRIPRRQR